MSEASGEVGDGLHGSYGFFVAEFGGEEDHSAGENALSARSDVASPAFAGPFVSILGAELDEFADVVGVG